MIAAAALGAIALVAGLAGFQLIPDTSLYARDGFHLWPAPLSNVGGLLAGHTGVVVVSAIAAASCVLLVRRRALFAIASCYWCLFPGVDALGVVFVLLAARRVRGPVPDRAEPQASCRRASPTAYLSMAAAAAVHPVAALTSFPILAGRSRPAFAACGFLTVSAIALVGVLDGFSTTDRYAFPLVALLALGVRS